MIEEQDKTSEKQVVTRDEHGRLLPGNTANLNGRPKGTYSLTTIIKKLLQEEKVTLKDGKEITAGEALTKKVLQSALLGDSKAVKLIWNYIDGLPPQSLDITSGGEQINRVEVEIVNRYKPEDTENKGDECT